MIKVIGLDIVGATVPFTSWTTSPTLDSVIQGSLIQFSPLMFSLFTRFIHPADYSSFKYSIPRKNLDKPEVVDRTLKAILPIFWAAPLQEFTSSQFKFSETFCPVALKNENCTRLRELATKENKLLPASLCSARKYMLARVLDEMYWSLLNTVVSLCRRAELTMEQDEEMQRYIEEADFSMTRFITHMVDNYVYYLYLLTCSPFKILELLEQF